MTIQRFLNHIHYGWVTRPEGVHPHRWDAVRTPLGLWWAQWVSFFLFVPPNPTLLGR
jgi:hypothetical protein